MDKDKRRIELSIRQALFILVISYIFALLTYYLPLDALSEYSFCEIYTIEAVPFALILGVVLRYLNS